MSYILGIDGGTESLRARLYDPSGRCVASAASPYPTQFAPGARAEQEPENWWKALGLSIRNAVAQAHVPRESIKALALTTTCCSVVVLGRDMKPLRPAIIWMDVRASREANDVLSTGDPALVVNGAGRGPVSAEWMIPKVLWISRNEPETFDRAATICEYQDFLNLRLTGRRTASLNNACIRWHYSTERGGWPRSLIEALGIGELRDKWPADVLAPGEVIGTLTADAAKHVGLSASTKVVQGGADALIGMIGLGVSRPGQLALITGSSHLQFAVTDQPLSKAGLWGAYRDAVYPGRYIVEGGQTSTGSIVNWLQRFTSGKPDLATLNVEAAKLPPGSDGLLVLDHFQGNRTPHTDPLSRGAIVGLTLAHGVPHVFRAVIEGICFGTRAILDTMANAGAGGREMTVGGGATMSDLWLQIHADTSGLPVCVPEASEGPSLGAGILAAVGAGYFSSIDDGIASMVHPGRRIEPRPRERAMYDEIYQRYLGLYPALKPLTKG